MGTKMQLVLIFNGLAVKWLGVGEVHEKVVIVKIEIHYEFYIIF